MMSKTVCHNRVAAFVPSTAVNRSHVRRQQLTRLAVAAVDEPAVAGGEDMGLNKEEAYARFEKLLDEYTFNFQNGDKVLGTVFKIEQKGVYVDVGGKSTAFCPTNELSIAPISRPTEVVGMDSAREFVVIRDERVGDLTLSLRRVELSVAWQRLRQYMEEDVVLSAKVQGVNRGGILVDIEGIRGFCPGSQLGQRVATFEELMGNEMQFKVTEVDEEKMRLMLSNRRVGAETRAASFKVGDVVEGTVSSVKPYGAFIDMGAGMSGLLHISQISHDRILNVDKVLSEGDKIKVMVLSQDRERGRVALCTKKLEPTPGDMLRDPALVYAKAEEMAALFRQRVEAAEAAARAQEADVAEGAAAQ